MKSQTSCTILGWGLSEENQRTYKLLFASNVFAKPVSEGCNYKKSGDFLCLEKSDKGICQGDSGSPLICDGEVWGVASHLVAYESSPNCGDDFEEYYGDIYPELEWINSYLNPTPTSGVSDPTADKDDGDAGVSDNSVGHLFGHLLLVAALLVVSLCGPGQ